ncbi:DNA-3-methyladenine glycosylase [Dyadobacter psychrotolerans]|uniref:Putative 3-methyladenine DNA glycosylase n=1 Tax=Dyadobacter psychrotolerans TaxID=2541721 RepID=A0A4R5DMV9_9BACT|nr:DNA-3-methyladenine glycosylase [Dyadobacter psychrotolerans]TDE15499.1 DNA-3-methyladenine glycosylase [Dyadobacter psychrotolerans]
MGKNSLPLSFYQSYDTLTLAQKLLGCELVHDSPDGITSGIIVETEAYLANDPACHAYNRRTARTEPMYSQAGTIYVYLIYGMYQCVNVVSNAEGIGEAVLIRALQPVQGIELMHQRRSLIETKTAKKIKAVTVKELCRGPGKLVKAMGIERDLHNNQLLDESTLYINKPEFLDFEIASSVRIGINVGVALPYRFIIKNNLFVSK